MAPKSTPHSEARDAAFPDTTFFKRRPGKNGGKWTKEEYLAQKAKRKAYNYKLALRLGVDPDMPVPKKIDMEIIVLLLNYNNKARDNRLQGLKPDAFFPVELFLYIWRNSYITKEGHKHLFSLAINDICIGMDWNYLKVKRGLKKLLAAGLIRDAGKAWKFSTGKPIKVYEIANLYRWLDAHKGLIPPIPANYKLKHRVARFTPPDKAKEAAKKLKEKRIRESDEAFRNNPNWGVFLNEDGTFIEQIDNNLNKKEKIKEIAPNDD